VSARVLKGVHAHGPASLVRHLTVHGELPETGPELIAEVERAGLVGRGGAAFPVATKLAAVAAGSNPVVVVNGTEGEPMSAKDLVLLTHVPHLVLDGAQAAARAVGAGEVLLAAPADTHPMLAAALDERPGEPRRRRVRVTLAASAGGYVAGEETALLAHLEGRPPRPRLTPPLPCHRGYRRRPTLVQNVETLAHLALVARHGAGWFREAGTPERPGTTLVTLAGAVREPGVYEVEPGVALRDLVDLAGGPVEPLRAMLVGGYFGGWLGHNGGLPLDDSALGPLGAAVGAGVVVALGESSCPLAETARLTAYLAGESAGQCGPCVHGLAALAGVVDRFARGWAEPGDGERLVRWIDMVRERGACRHPDGVARMLASAVREFGAEFETHARRGPCRACAGPAPLVLPGAEAAVA
jgi:NADH:ubiquinone oxidoreductase subunit F (NADH-binding)